MEEERDQFEQDAEDNGDERDELQQQVEELQSEIEDLEEELKNWFKVFDKADDE